MIWIDLAHPIIEQLRFFFVVQTVRLPEGRQHNMADLTVRRVKH